MAAVALVRRRTETASGNGVDMEGESSALPGCRGRADGSLSRFFVGDRVGHDFTSPASQAARMLALISLISPWSST